MDELEELIEELQETVKKAVSTTPPENYVHVQEWAAVGTRNSGGRRAAANSIFQENVMEIDKILGELDEPDTTTSPVPGSQRGSGVDSPAFALESLMQDLKDFQLQHELAFSKLKADAGNQQQPQQQQQQAQAASPAMRRNFGNQQQQQQQQQQRQSGGAARPGGRQQQQQQQQAAAPAVDMTKCAACNETIQGQLVKALGRAWHYEHFVCSGCRAELGKQNFYEKDTKPFCEPCYQAEFSPKCAYCNEPILDRCITALEKSWHPEHFFCQECTAPFNESSGFHERNGKPYCADCYNDAFAPKCNGCKKAITSNYVTAMDSMWHTECFVCRDCGSDFSSGNFYEHNGQPYCELHYHAHRGSLCITCEKPITSKCITAMGRKFHPECFQCAFCNNELSRGTFMEKEGKPYCNDCYGKLFVQQ